MPVSHIGLTVSHLPSSCSFYLAALQPLGYRYIGQQDNQIGFGVEAADFFLCQDSPGNPPGPAHIAFSAPSHQAVDSFFTAALKAGGRVHDGPAVRDSTKGYYSAAVVDFDGNSIEVVHRETDEGMSTVSSAKGSRMLDRKEASAESVADTSQTRERPSISTVVGKIITTTTTSLLSSQQSSQRDPTASSQALVGTLLGAAAGAAIAYAMVKSENESKPPLTPEVRHRQTIHQTIEAPPTPRTVVSYQDHGPSSEPSHASIHRSTYPTHIRAIEAPPSPPSDYFSYVGMPHRSLPPTPSVHTMGPSETTRLTLRPPPLTRRTTEPSTHSVVLDPVPRDASRISRTSHRTHSSRTNRARSVASPSRGSTCRSAADLPLPPSTKTSVTYRSSTDHTIRTSTIRSAKAATNPPSPSDFPLPASASPSIVYRNAADFQLPDSAKSFVPSQIRTHHPHHTSGNTSTLSRLPADRPLPASTKTSHHSRSPADYPLPVSAKASSASRPGSKAPSVVSVSSASTVRPLTRATVEKASTDIADLGSVAPSDSISQVSNKHRRRKHKHRDEGERAGGSGARSAVTEPAKGGRSIAAAFGLGR